MVAVPLQMPRSEDEVKELIKRHYSHVSDEDTMVHILLDAHNRVPVRNPSKTTSQATQRLTSGSKIGHLEVVAARAWVSREGCLPLSKWHVGLQTREYPWKYLVDEVRHNVTGSMTCQRLIEGVIDATKNDQAPRMVSGVGTERAWVTTPSPADADMVGRALVHPVVRAVNHVAHHRNNDPDDEDDQDPFSQPMLHVVDPLGQSPNGPFATAESNNGNALQTQAADIDALDSGLSHPHTPLSHNTFRTPNAPRRHHMADSLLPNSLVPLPVPNPISPGEALVEKMGNSVLDAEIDILHEFSVLSAVASATVPRYLSSHVPLSINWTKPKVSFGVICDGIYPTGDIAVEFKGPARQQIPEGGGTSGSHHSLPQHIAEILGLANRSGKPGLYVIFAQERLESWFILADVSQEYIDALKGKEHWTNAGYLHCFEYGPYHWTSAEEYQEAMIARLALVSFKHDLDVKIVRRQILLNNSTLGGSGEGDPTPDHEKHTISQASKSVPQAVNNITVGVAKSKLN